ncbi:hypothetical protein BOX15_Mlig017644g1 [Macrostomum lignano]|uniref:Uncharacterized protein n=1 Tax=Macrostomum lignano TaxID=282301 RepID=A0A267FMM6_9PLAT|nr:hypothetical protein BOX15_Mlig017644g1 [Macrostomum lignano]
MQAPRCLFRICFEPLLKQPDSPKYLHQYVLSLRHLLECNDELGFSTRAQWLEYLQSALLAACRLFALCSRTAAQSAWPHISKSHLSKIRRAVIEGLTQLNRVLRNPSPELVAAWKLLSSAGESVNLGELDNQLTAWFNRIGSSGLALLSAQTARAGALDSTPDLEKRQLCQARQLFEHLGVRNLQEASASLGNGMEQFLRCLSAGTEASDTDCELFRNCANKLQSGLRTALDELEATALKAIVAASSAAASPTEPAAAPEQPAVVAAPLPTAAATKRSVHPAASRSCQQPQKAAATSEECGGSGGSGGSGVYRRLLRCSMNTPAVSESLMDIGVDATSTPSPRKQPMLRQNAAPEQQQQQPQETAINSNPPVVVIDNSANDRNSSKNKGNSTNRSNSDKPAGSGNNNNNNSSSSSSISSDGISSDPDDVQVVQSSPNASSAAAARPGASRRPVLDLSQEMRGRFTSSASSVRQRRPWNERDSFLLYIGHARYGSDWVNIRNRLLSHAARTNVQIKDRWRNMLNRNIPGRISRRLRQLGFSDEDVRAVEIEDLMEQLRSDLDLRSIFL